MKDEILAPTDKFPYANSVHCTVYCIFVSNYPLEKYRNIIMTNNKYLFHPPKGDYKLIIFRQLLM